MAKATLRWVPRLGAVAVGVALLAGVAAAGADDPKPKADAKVDPALREELLKLNQKTGEESQRAALLKLVKDKAKAKTAVAAALKIAKAEKDSKPFNYNACLILARAAHFVHDYDAGEFFYEQCIEQATKVSSGSKIIQAYDGLVDLYWDAKRFQAVIDTCERFLDLDSPEEVKEVRGMFLERQIQAMARAGQTDQALAMTDRLIKLNPASWYALQLKGYVLREAGKTDAAIEAYTQAIGKLDTDKKVEKEVKDRFKDRLRYILSGLYVDAKNIDKAAEELQALIKRNPENPTYKNDLGFIWADNDKNLEESEKLVREALELDKKRQQKAVDDGLIDEVKENAAYLDSMGWVLFKQKKYKEALKYLEQAVADEEEGNHLEIWDHLADCYLAMGQTKKAVQTWEKGLKLEDLGPRDKERRRAVVAKLQKAREDLKGDGE
ncbi:MAG TPA: tetratricopeptide repeat protein [Gemmataceae bacterium]|nr:tetratricopeptide repeat protein [Gemmataceae bacterium]